MEIFDLEENRRKYADESGKDVIERYEALSAIGTMQGCIMLGIDKYAKRYISDSKKAALESDVYKMLDYSNRIHSILIKMHSKGVKGIIECCTTLFDIQNCIQNSNFVEVQKHCMKLFVQVDELRISATV